MHANDGDRGSWNPTGLADAELVARIVSLSSETELNVRNATIAEIWSTVQDEQLYLALHHQVLNWVMTDAVGTEASPEDAPKFKHFAVP